MKDKTISWRNFMFPLCIVMAILTFVFFAPLVSVDTSKGQIQCSILELLKLQGQYGTVESLIYFVVGWIGAIALDKFLIQKILVLFSKENRLQRKKTKKEWNELKENKELDD